ncbi:MAG: hypothetical protein Q9220_001309 [cf. Caloplaca sp. 1 TL-2023]
MHCNICRRPCSDRLPFNCTVCAQSTIYQFRVGIASTLIEQEAASSRVEQILSTFRSKDLQSLVAKSSTPLDQRPPLRYEAFQVEESALKERIRLVLDRTKDLDAAVKRLREQTPDQRASNLQRRKDLVAATQDLARRQALSTEPFEKAISKTRKRWELLHTRTVESRLLLCREAANLYSLQKRSDRGPGRYAIGGLQIPDLRKLNSEAQVSIQQSYTRLTSKGSAPTDVTTVNTSIAHLIHLIAHYLSLRLPAEITLPRRDDPLTTILPPGLPYAAQDFGISKGSSGPSSASHSPSGSRALNGGRMSRSRPLHFGKRLSSLAKDDPPSYAAVIEGMTLLAWDVAWLCKTQGLEIGSGSWEEICDIGGNLWKLLVARPSSLNVMEIKQHDHQGGDNEAHNRSASSAVPSAINLGPMRSSLDAPSLFGQYSHGTVHSNLATAAGSDYMRGWRLQDPAKIVEKVKQMLLNERTGAGWEILEGKEWEPEPVAPGHHASMEGPNASTVVLSSNFQRGKDQQAHESKSTMPNIEVDDKSKGTSGWTKLKNR